MNSKQKVQLSIILPVTLIPKQDAYLTDKLDYN